MVPCSVRWSMMTSGQALTVARAHALCVLSSLPRPFACILIEVGESLSDKKDIKTLFP